MLSALDSARSSPVLLLATLGTRLMAEVRDAHAELGLRPRQFEVLALLDAHGTFDQLDLVARMNVSASALVAVLNPLEEEGCVTRDRSVGNRKRNTVSITPDGRRLLERAVATQHRLDSDLLTALSGQQVHQLTDLLSALREGDILSDPNCDVPHWIQARARGEAEGA